MRGNRIIKTGGGEFGVGETKLGMVWLFVGKKKEDKRD